jgi:hypothetical protein
MKLFRTLAIVPLALISLMNVGYILPTDPKHNVAVVIAVVALGVAGLGAVYGLARNTPWGIPTALVVSAVNVAAAVVALVADEEGAIVGLVVSAVALATAFAASSAQRKVSVA